MRVQGDSRVLWGLSWALMLPPLLGMGVGQQRLVTSRESLALGQATDLGLNLPEWCLLPFPSGLQSPAQGSLLMGLEKGDMVRLA